MTVEEALKALIESQNQTIELQRNVIRTMKADLSDVSRRLHQVEVMVVNHDAYFSQVEVVGDGPIDESEIVER